MEAEQSSSTGPGQEIFGSERITFVVPSSSDFERITGFKNFTALWSVGGSGKISANSDAHSRSVYSSVSHNDGYPSLLNLKDNDERHTTTNGLHNFFASLTNGGGGGAGGDDFHQILNYVWIGAVVTLVVLSLIFIVFSVYFYRKFIEWKKCNKDIQSQIPNDLQQPYGHEDIYAKLESPPCYTIATGLPTYSEALILQHYEHQLGYLWLPSCRNHSQQQQHQPQDEQRRQQLEGHQLQQQHLPEQLAFTANDAETIKCGNESYANHILSVLRTNFSRVFPTGSRRHDNSFHSRSTTLDTIISSVDEVTSSSHECTERSSNLTDVVVLS